MSLAGVIALLGLAMPMYSTRAELEASVDKAATSNQAVGGKDFSFDVNEIDWSKLDAADPSSDFADMKQSLGFTCLLNSVRFALQRRHNVMLGQRPHGDRIVWSMIYGFTSDAQFPAKYRPTASAGGHVETFDAKSLAQAYEWLNKVEIKANREERTTSLKAFLNANPGPKRMVFVAGRSNSVPHNYVIYQTQAKLNGLELKVYDPWTGKNLVHNNSEWIDADDLELNYALPMGLTTDVPQPGQPTYYSVLFIPSV